MSGKLAENVAYFARALRAAGLPVGPGAVVEAIAALEGGALGGRDAICLGRHDGHPAVRLVRYPGEGHGNRRAASQLDAAVRIAGWFEHYLLGPGGAPPPAAAADEVVRGIVEAAKK